MSQDYVVGPRGPGGTFNAGHGAAIYLPHRKHPPIMIQNTGTATVFANNEDPISAPSPGQPISAGSMLSWDKDRPLYVTCATSSTITITENTGTLVDIGSLSSQISVALTAGGLASAIAANIKISGAPPIDNFQSIGIFAQTVSNGSASPVLDMRGFQSLFVGLTNTGNMIQGQFLVFWYAEQAAINVIELDSIYIGVGFNTQFSMAAKGPWCQINVAASSGSAVMSPYGSYKSLVNNSYGAQGAGANFGTVELTGTADVQTWSGVIPINTLTWVWSPDVVAGHNKLSFRTIGASNFSYFVRPPNNVGSVTTYAATAGTPSATAMVYDDLLLPPAPLEINVNNLSTTATLTFRATLVSARPYAN